MQRTARRTSARFGALRSMKPRSPKSRRFADAQARKVIYLAEGNVAAVGVRSQFACPSRQAYPVPSGQYRHVARFHPGRDRPPSQRADHLRQVPVIAHGSTAVDKTRRLEQKLVRSLKGNSMRRSAPRSIPFLRTRRPNARRAPGTTANSCARSPPASNPMLCVLC